MIQEDVTQAVNNLLGKQSRYNELWRYYRGNHPLWYSTDRLREIFGKMKYRFVQNWCKVVVRSVVDRIQLTGWEVSGSPQATAKLTELWAHTEMDIDYDDAHLAAIVTGEAMVVVEEDEEEGISAYYNDPTLVHVQYETEHPRKKQFAAKWWKTSDKRYHLNMYYEDRFEYYITQPMESAPKADAFAPAEPDQEENTYGCIPVFHLRPERSDIVSELDPSILSMQDAINKLLSDMMVAAEFGAFPQRWVISNSSIGKLKNKPGEIWKIPSSDGIAQASAVGQLMASSLKNYLEGINDLSGAIAIISQTPRFYFFSTGQVPSGEALMALEAPLNKKCTRYTKRFGSEWRRFAHLLLRLGGIETELQSITPVWAPVETILPQSQSTVRVASVQAGLPLTTVLRHEGWSEKQIDAMKQDRAEEQLGDAQLATLYAQNARENFDQEMSNGNTDDNE